MSEPCPRVWSCLCLAVIAAIGCTDGATEDIGNAREALAGTYCILNAKIAPGTFHFDGPNWLLNSAEAHGPQDLQVQVSQFVQPQISTNTDFKPSGDDVSNAVGYSVTERYQIQASSTFTVGTNHFTRLEAYTAFQKSLWEIRDASCTRFLGIGTSYRPVGVFFQTRDASDVAVPDVGIYTFGPSAPPGGVGGLGGPVALDDDAGTGGDHGDGGNGGDHGDGGNGGDSGDAGDGGAEKADGGQ